MKLSDQLQQDHLSGDFGDALEGYSDRAKKLEDAAWSAWHKEASNWGATNQQAVDFANEQLEKI